jgi:hypothetical protein
VAAFAFRFGVAAFAFGFGVAALTFESRVAALTFGVAADAFGGPDSVVRRGVRGAVASAGLARAGGAGRGLAQEGTTSVASMSTCR